MAISDDPNASDNEVYVAIAKAQKLMIKYNVDKSQILETNVQKENVIEFWFDDMYPSIYRKVAFSVAKNFRCDSIIRTFRQKCMYGIFGLEEDVENAKLVIKKIFLYLNIRLKKYVKEYRKKYKEDLFLRMMEPPLDARIIKKSYAFGFAHGLENKFEESINEAKQLYGETTALAVIDVPQVVRNYTNQKVKGRVAHPQKANKLSSEAYEKGRIEGSDCSLF